MIIPAVALVGIMGFASTQGGGGESAAPQPVTSMPAATTEAPTDEPSEEALEEPAEEVIEVPAEPEAPKMTVSEEQALRKAESYLDYTAFSRKGLIEQLKYEGFSSDDAKFAVDHVDVDWMEQAELKAKSYLEYTSFSRKGLIEQLEYEGFTRKQAEHGADAVGL